MATGKVIQADHVVGLESKPNLIENPFGFIGTRRWNAVEYASGDSRPKGVPMSGAPDLTLTAEEGGLSTAPKRLKISKASGVNAQKQAIEYVMPVPSGYQTQMLELELLYKTVSAGFKAGGLGVGSADDSSLIVYCAQSSDGSSFSFTEPQGGFKFFSKDMPDTYRGWVQVNSDTTHLKLILYVARTETDAWDFEFEAAVKPSNIAYGTPITDWQSYTPAYSPESGSITNATIKGYHRRVGDSVEVTGVLTFSAASSEFIGFRVVLPSGMTVDSTKIETSPFKQLVGSAFALEAGIQLFGTGNVTLLSSKVVDIRLPRTISGANPVSIAAVPIGNTMPFTFGNGDSVSWTFKVPIQGWSSGAQLSDGYDGRVVAATVIMDQRTDIAPNLSHYMLPLNRAENDTVNGFDSSTSRYLIKTPGLYEISAGAYLYATNLLADRYYGIRIWHNGDPNRLGGAPFTPKTNGVGNVYLSHPSVLVKAKAGDYIRLSLFSDGNHSTNKLELLAAVHIHKLSGSAFMSLTETVSVMATKSDGKSIPNAMPTTIDGWVKVEDSHGAFNASTGIFTAPEAGVYRVIARAEMTAHVSAQPTLMLNFAGKDFYDGTCSTTGPDMRMMNIVEWPLKAGETIRAYLYQSSGSSLNLTTRDRTSISITKLK